MDFLALKKNLKQDFSILPTKKVAILADSATQLLSQAIKGYGFTRNIHLDIFEADYDQIEQYINDPSSDLYRVKYDYIVLFYSAEKFTQKFYTLSAESKVSAYQEFSDQINNLYQTIQSRSQTKVICFNLSVQEDAIFGNFSNKIVQSLNYQIRKINVALMELAQIQNSLFILDLDVLKATHGHLKAFDPKLYTTSDMVFSMDCVVQVAKSLRDMICAMEGQFKKCVILDLDNTLWGGVIGDDGLANIHIGDLGIGKAFSAFQLWLKQLKQRGIILAVCSKNDEAIAKEPFEKHPDMILKLDDFAVFVANWDNKVDNINHIQSVLNIGFDAMVFLDDNPFERAMVKENIKDITVVELPEDPAEYLSYLKTQNLFETASFVESDQQRTQQYQQEDRRKNEQKSFKNEDEFLKSIEMYCKVDQLTDFTIPRVAQLTQRSNQFNLRTVRYAQEDIKRFANDSNCIALTFHLKDRFGDHGLISTVIIEKRGQKAFIDTWIMSCRVLNRGVEKFVLNTIVEYLAQESIDTLIGEYLPTIKNELVKDHYNKLGFKSVDKEFHLNVSTYKPFESFIQSNQVRESKV